MFTIASLGKCFPNLFANTITLKNKCQLLHSNESIACKIVTFVLYIDIHSC